MLLAGRGIRRRRLRRRRRCRYRAARQKEVALPMAAGGNAALYRKAYLARAALPLARRRQKYDAAYLS